MISLSGQPVATGVSAVLAGWHTPGPFQRRDERRALTRRKGISKKLRFEVFKRDGFKCQYCGRSAPDVLLRLDHLHPVSKGGEDDLLNLITACFDCNAGKSDVLLTDAAAIKKQREQLDALNERREQMEMMLKWREGLRSIEQSQLDAVAEAHGRAVPGFRLNELGLRETRKLLRKFGLSAVLNAIDIAAVQYVKLEDGKATQESADKVYAKIGGICAMEAMPERDRRLYLIRGIVRHRLSYCIDWKAFDLLKRAAALDASLDYLEELARRAGTWTQWCSWMTDLIVELSGGGNGGS